MSPNAETEQPDQMNNSINKPKMGSILHRQRSKCPIAREITHRLQIPPIIAESGSVDAGNVSLSRDDFCPESAHCVLCSLVTKLRSAGTSRKSVHFVLNEFTNDKLRRWMVTQLNKEKLPPESYLTTDIVIVATSGANVFQAIQWDMEKAYYYPQEHDPEGCILGLFRLWKCQAPSSTIPAPKVDTLTYITKEAKQWLHVCDKDHKVCKSLVSSSTPPISLIDCNHRCLVHGSEGMRYVALSYVWGTTGRNFNPPERQYGVPLDGLPLTISDAITVTKSFGYDYLWVDMLCIDQRSKEDKHREIAIMDRIYRSADVTIVVAAGIDCGDGIPGVSERCRPPRLSITVGNTILVEEKENPANEIEASVWRSRGWTFQEGLLSRRRVVFTDSQISFSCFSAQGIEHRAGPEFSQTAVGPAPLVDRRHGRDTIFGDTSFLKTDSSDRTTLTGTAGLYRYGFPIAFAELLEKYSTLCFSFESDMVDAFRAIGNMFALRTPPVLHLYGLPFISGDEPTTSSSLTRGLAWCLERGNEETMRRPNLPSWSWLGYRGPVRWGAMLRDGAADAINEQWSAKTFSHVILMITASDSMFRVSQLSAWWREWSSAKGSEGLAPLRLIIVGYMIPQEFWLGAECKLYTGHRLLPHYTLTGKEPWFINSQYRVGSSLMMSEHACQRLLENLTKGGWKALLLTDDFLLIIESVATGAKGGPYRRVGSADINIFHLKELYRLARDEFVKRCTKLVDIELV